MTSTDFIKVRGLQSTPGEGADVSSFEIFQGIGCDGSGAAGVTNLPTLPIAPTIPTIPTVPGSPSDTLSRLFGLIGSLAGTVGEIIKETAFVEIVEGIVGLVAAGAGSAALAALTYLLTKLIGKFALDYLDEKTGFEAYLMEEIRKIREHMEACNLCEKLDATNLSLQGMADNVFNARNDLFELRKYLQTGVGDENLQATLNGLIQAVQDLRFNDETLHLPGSDAYIKLNGKSIQK